MSLTPDMQMLIKRMNRQLMVAACIYGLVCIVLAGYFFSSDKNIYQFMVRLGVTFLVGLCSWVVGGVLMRIRFTALIRENKTSAQKSYKRSEVKAAMQTKDEKMLQSELMLMAMIVLVTALLLWSVIGAFAVLAPMIGQIGGVVYYMMLIEKIPA